MFLVYSSCVLDKPFIYKYMKDNNIMMSASYAVLYDSYWYSYGRISP